MAAGFLYLPLPSFPLALGGRPCRTAPQCCGGGAHATQQQTPGGATPFDPPGGHLMAHNSTAKLSDLTPVTATGDVTLVQGDTYTAADVTWTDTASTWPADVTWTDTASTWPADIATADSLTWYADTLEIACTYNAWTSAIELGALTSAQTNELQAGSHAYRIVARWTVGSRVETIGSGTLNVETYRP